MPRRYFTEEEIKQIVTFRKGGSTFAAIARTLQCSDQAVWNAYHRHRYGLKRAKRPFVSRAMSISPEEEKAALAKVPLYDTRSLTGIVFGDPLPERSALASRAC